MIDTHCHLTDPRLLSQIDAVLQRAADAGVSHIISIGTDVVDDRATIEVCRGRPNVRAAVGVHPCYVDESQTSQLAELEAMMNDSAVVAIGECGLDYFHDASNKAKQLEFFLPQLQLASDTGKAMVIHSRLAIDDCLAAMRDFPNVRAVFHCFTGTMAEARRVLDAGYLISITGVVTYKKPGDVPEVVGFTPIDRLMVETDAPYLSPEPLRKVKVCEPGFVMHTATKVAEIKKVTIEELDRITTATAERFFEWTL